MTDDLTERRKVRVREQGGGWLSESLADPEFRQEFDRQMREAAATDTHSENCSKYKQCPCGAVSCWHALPCDCGGDDREFVYEPATR